MDHENGLTPRGLYISAPTFRPTFLDHPTLLITYWCSLFCVFLILGRLFWRFFRLSKAYKVDWWMVASIVPLGIRLGLAHLVLIWGTNNISLAGFDEFRIPQNGGEYVKWGLDKEIGRRENGSKTVLAARVAYTAFIWSQKLCITEFHSKLNLSFWHTSYNGVLGTIRWALVVTFLGVVISIFTECTPFQKYCKYNLVWDISGHWAQGIVTTELTCDIWNQGKCFQTQDVSITTLWLSLGKIDIPCAAQCREGVAPLIVMAVCNAATDVLIVIFPLPPILLASMPLKRRFWLIVSLSLSLITCALAIYRVSFVLQYHASQPHRTLYSSIECLASCAIANAIVLNSFARDKGPKRKRYRGPGGAHMVYSPEAIAIGGRMTDQEQLDIQNRRTGMRVWGSDEDLVKGTGLGMNEDLRKMSGAALRHSAFAVRSLSEMDLPSNAEGAHRHAPWVAAWENEVGLWTERSENEIGSGKSRNANAIREKVKTPASVRKVGDGQLNDWQSSPSRKISFLDVGGLLSSDQKVNGQNQ
ncbi:hypothetical protein EV426DRAFT_710710 [Tirmania nivea]|nr:hypothetical protein EV426DRAFT_710710 [Tirmania nivea]